MWWMWQIRCVQEIRYFYFVSIFLLVVPNECLKGEGWCKNVPIISILLFIPQIDFESLNSSKFKLKIYNYYFQVCPFQIGLLALALPMTQTIHQTVTEKQELGLVWCWARRKRAEQGTSIWECSSWVTLLAPGWVSWMLEPDHQTFLLKIQSIRIHALKLNKL